MVGKKTQGEVRMKELERGTKVKLTKKGVHIFTSSTGVQRRAHPNWKARTGTVLRVVTTKTHAMVVWDGNKYASDAIPVSIIEPVE